MRVIDGMHRLRAALLRGDDTIETIFYDGPEDLFVRAVRLNSTHGLPLSTVDRAAAATRIISSHAEWSDRAIAAVVGISDKTVAAIRRRSSAEFSQSNVRVGRDGRRRQLDSSDGRRLAGELMSEHPQASLREIARRAGISPSTASDVRDRLRRGRDVVPLRQRAPGRSTGSRVPGIPEQRGGESVQDVVSILRELSRDPALRSREQGREVLRLLNVHALDAQAWERFVSAVPPHRAATVADLARRCADSWSRFAQRMEMVIQESANARPTDYSNGPK